MDEIESNKKEILEKAAISEADFQSILESLKLKMKSVPESEIINKLPEAKEIMHAIDPDDVPFIAAALATGAGIWSDNKHFQKQKKIKVWKTEELAKVIL